MDTNTLPQLDLEPFIMELGGEMPHVEFLPDDELGAYWMLSYKSPCCGKVIKRRSRSFEVRFEGARAFPKPDDARHLLLDTLQILAIGVRHHRDEHEQPAAN